MSLKKTYSKDNATCKVYFSLSQDVCKDAESVCVVGDFNNWNVADTPMKRAKDGSFELLVTLETGREYYFRYLIDGLRWENDWNADKYIPSPYGDAYNSVVIV